MKTLNVMGFDLGASSGRGILGSFDGDKLTLREIHRFPHNFTIMNGHAFWNVLSLYDAMKESLRLCPEKLDGMGFDTWGVDCGVLDAQGNLLGLPMSYRDAALDDDNMRQVLDELGAEYLCEQTGIANLAYNTLYKLSYLKREMPAQLESADRILFMPNLFEYLFSGVAHAEYSIASTSQLFNMREKRWACEIMDKLGFHRDWFPEVDYSGKILGKVRADVGEQTGQPQAAVISVAGHDTACAVAAVPSAEEEFTFLSCGTWSLLGVSARQMMDTQAVLRDQIIHGRQALVVGNGVARQTHGDIETVHRVCGDGDGQRVAAGAAVLCRRGQLRRGCVLCGCLGAFLRDVDQHFAGVFERLTNEEHLPVGVAVVDAVTQLCVCSVRARVRQLDVGTGGAVGGLQQRDDRSAALAGAHGIAAGALEVQVGARAHLACQLIKLATSHLT